MAFQPNIAGLSLPVQAGPAVTYINGVQVSASEWDFTLLFSMATPRWAERNEGGEPVPITSEVRVVQGVVMSPQQAKVLLAILDRNMTRWEQENGEVKIASRVMEEIGRQEAAQQEAARAAGSASEHESSGGTASLTNGEEEEQT